jgi:hypothetical protein
MSEHFGNKVVSSFLCPRNHIVLGGRCNLAQRKRAVAAGANHLGEKMMDAAQVQY